LDSVQLVQILFDKSFYSISCDTVIVRVGHREFDYDRELYGEEEEAIDSKAETCGSNHTKNTSNRNSELICKHCVTKNEEEVEGNSERFEDAHEHQETAGVSEYSPKTTDSDNDKDKQRTENCVAGGIEPESADGSNTEDDDLKTRYDVNRIVLRQSSAFFRAATKARWSGSGHRSIDLTTERSCDFGKYLQWLYSNRISVEYNLDVESDDERDPYWSRREPVQDLLHSYLLGERLMVPNYQNAVSKALIDCLAAGHRPPSNLVVGKAYKGTAASSPIRKRDSTRLYDVNSLRFTACSSLETMMTEDGLVSTDEVWEVRNTRCKIYIKVPDGGASASFLSKIARQALVRQY
jgi:hypothetical protein